MGMKHLPLLLLLLTSCTTQRKCNRLFPPTVTVQSDTVFVPVTVEIPGEKVTDILRIHDTTFIKEITERVTVRESASGKAELRYWMDAYGNLVIECEAKEQFVELLNRYVNTTRTETRTVTPDWVWVVVGFGIVGWVFAVVRGFHRGA
jgi:hypothetical protein